MTHVEKTRRLTKRTASSRKSREHEPRLRQSILEAARELFAKEGYERVSMRRIGVEVGCSPMAMYQYFSSKEDLLVSICEETYEFLEQEQMAKIAACVSPLERLRAALKSSVVFAISNPNPYKLIFLTPIPSGPQTKRRLGIHQKLISLYSTLVTECIREKGLTLDVKFKVDLLRAGIHGIVIGTIVNMFSKKEIQPLIETMINALTRDLE